MCKQPILLRLQSTGQATGADYAGASERIDRRPPAPDIDCDIPIPTELIYWTKSVNAMKMPRLPIDAYDLRARLFPALMISFPTVAFVYGVIPSARSFWGGISGSILEAALLYALMRIGRDRGASMQEKLFRSWGGRPTTILLRYRNDLVDRHTKDRYKQTLAQLSGLTFPTEAEEVADPIAADKIYDSAVRALIEQRRTKKYDLAFKENCNYGFVRNLVGLRPIGLFTISLILPADMILYLRIEVDRRGIWLSVLVSVLTALLLILMNKNSVRRTADAYALALLRTCDRPPKRSNAS